METYKSPKKFRAKMFGDKTTGHIDEMYVYCNGVGVDSWNSKHGRYYGLIEPNSICQFIGQYDSNGDEIYETDILTDDFCSFMPWVVQFKNGTFGVANIYNGDPCDEHFPIDKNDYFSNRTVLKNKKKVKA